MLQLFVLCSLSWLRFCVNASAKFCVFDVLAWLLCECFSSGWLCCCLGCSLVCMLQLVFVFCCLGIDFVRLPQLMFCVSAFWLGFCVNASTNLFACFLSWLWFCVNASAMFYCLLSWLGFA